MADEYKIGAIAKLLGISPQTLHYYEQCGLLTPKKDDRSNYRYYDPWDVNFLLDCKYFQSLGFSNGQIKKMILDDSLDEIEEKLLRQKEKILNEIYHYEKLSESLDRMKKRLDAIHNSTGIFEKKINPALYFKSYRTENHFHDMQDSDKMPEIADMLNHLPFVEPTFVLDLNGENTISQISRNILKRYRWGFSFTLSAMRDWELDIKGIEYIASAKCKYTIFKAYDEHTFAQCLKEQVLQKLLDQGYLIGGPVLGRLIIRTHEQGDFVRYFEVWVPALHPDQKNLKDV